MAIDKNLEQRIREFVDTHPDILAAYNGIDPESGMDTIYFVTGRVTYESGLDDDVSMFDIESARNGYKGTALLFPVTPQRISEYSFIQSPVYIKPTDEAA